MHRVIAGRPALTDPQRWVMWLPMFLVTLPTVCLLWFMAQAVKSEHLAARHRLIEVYKRQAVQAVSRIEERWLELIGGIKSFTSGTPAKTFQLLILQTTGPNKRLPEIKSLLILGPEGRVVYPIGAFTDEPESGYGGQFGSAFRAEYLWGDMIEAARLYQQIALSDTGSSIRAAAAMGAVRCLCRAGKAKEAVDLIKKVLDDLDPSDTDLASIANLNVKLLEIMAQASMPEVSNQAARLLAWALDYDLNIPSAARAFCLARALELLPKAMAEGQMDRHELAADRLRQAELIGLSVAEALGLADGSPVKLHALPDGTVFSLPSPDIAVLAIEAVNCRLLVVMDRRALMDCAQGLLSADLPPEVCVRVRDGDSRARQMAGLDATFLASFALGRLWPNWQAEFYLPADLPLLNAARRQKTIYIWTGTLMITVSITIGLVATEALRQQNRLNRLKNDLIATVTHELKTPLTSMRLLVDTMLEGRVTDESQAREYLELMARENARLSGLIEGFLTFSRMDRNKYTFNMSPIDPCSVAQDAAEAVRAKWSQVDYKLDLEIPLGLPKIYADHDAMVTVLINLLDNALKYTEAHKLISLSVTSRDGYVYMSVCDNGIGIPRRAFKRIFERFFQVDTSLSRKASGCGLGLAIVKFIVTAHNGKISVWSKLGQGSIFTVRLPVWRPSSS